MAVTPQVEASDLLSAVNEQATRIGNGTPRCFQNFRAHNALAREGSHFGFQIAAHEIEFVDIILIGRMERGFCRR